MKRGRVLNAHAGTNVKLLKLFESLTCVERAALSAGGCRGALLGHFKDIALLRQLVG